MELDMKQDAKQDRGIGNDVRLIHNMIGAYCEKMRAQEHDDVPAMQGRTLGYLYYHRAQEIYQKDIEQEFCISRATATKMLQSMEKKELIYRKPVLHDARLKQIIMTDKGELHHKRTIKNFIRLEQTLVKDMTEEEADLLSSLLKRARKNLEETE